MVRTLSSAVDLVAPFASTDETRPHLCKPARHAGHVVATDGHTMGVARFDGEGHDLVRTNPGSEGPPWQQVTPAAPVCVGKITRSAIEPLRHFPAKWLVIVTLAPDGHAHFEAVIPARTGKHGKVRGLKVVVVKRSALDGFENLRVAQPIGVNAAYLVRCFDLATMGVMPSCYVHATGALDPLVLAPEMCTTRDALIACPQFAITMGVHT